MEVPVVLLEASSFGVCEKCPALIHCVNLVNNLEKLKSKTLSDAIDPIHDETADLQFEELSRASLLDIVAKLVGRPITDGPELVHALRQLTDEEAEILDEQIKKETETATVMTTDCQGPLKMRAKKAGRLITATICNSPLIPDGSNCETIHTKRDRDFS